MPPCDIDELGVTPCRPDRNRVAEGKNHDACDPQPETKPDRGSERGIGDREPARRARATAGFFKLKTRLPEVIDVLGLDPGAPRLL